MNQPSNAHPTGTIDITGVSAVGNTLSAQTSSLADADGLGTLSYMWLRNGEEIPGETAAAYLITEADAGARLEVRVTYADGAGTEETITSADVAIQQSSSGAENIDPTQNALLNALATDAIWPATTVTYAFYEQGDQYDTSPPFGSDGVSDGWSDADRDEVRAAFAELSTFLSIDFVESQSTNTANIALAQDVLGGNTAGYAFLPEPPLTSNVVLDTAEMDRGLSISSQLIVHELGHAMGLEHPFEGITFPGVTDGDHTDPGDFALNQVIFTTMSYTLNLTTPGIPSAEFYANEYGYGALDIAALQIMYGANENHSVGSNVYEAPTRHLTIWDTGGADELNFSSQSLDSVIDLRAATLNVEEGGGGFVSYVKTPAFPGSPVQYEPDGLYTIAHGVLIEDAMGGSGDDIITGNEAANDLNGLQGDDSILGGGGDDNLNGGDGAPLDGVVLFATEFAGQSAQADINDVPALGNAFTVDAYLTIDATDTQRHGVMSFQPNGGDGEFLQLLVLDDSLILQVGTGAFSYTTFTTGILRSDLNDGDPHRLTMTVDITAGQVVFYLDGLEKFTVDVPAVELITATAFPGKLELGNADAAFDNSYTMNGFIGDVAIYNTVLSSQAIADRGTAQRSAPTDANIQHLWSSDGSLSALPNLVDGGPDGVLSGVQFVNSFALSSDNDTLRGEAGNDTLTGGIGDDLLDGGVGNDVFFAGVDADTVTTGTGDDVVTVQDNGDTTIVTDFAIGSDKIDLRGFDVQDAVDAVTDMAAGTAELVFDSGTRVILQGVSNTAFTVQDVILNQPNTPATGNLAIAGTPTQNETLTLDVSDIQDVDGIQAASVAIQWTRDGVAIDGATGTTYQLTQADVGRSINATYSFVDELGMAESFTATALDIANVDDPLQGAPVIQGNARLGQTLSVDTSGLTDPDGLDPQAFTYQWLREGVDIAGATGATYVIVAADIGAQLSVQVGTADNAGGVGTAASAVTATVEDNMPATGQPVISGTLLVGETLTVDLSGVADPDGFDPMLATVQWLADGVPIAGATGTELVLSAAQEDQTITVAYSFTDGLGGQESVTSAATGPVVPLNAPAQGAVSIGAQAAVGAILTADLSQVSDGNGIDTDTLSYVWSRTPVDGVSTFIADATGSSYTVTEDDTGATLSVEVSFTDEDGYAETVSSNALVVNTPVSGEISILGGIENNAILTVDISQLVDPDGFDTSAFGYQWSRNGEDITGPEGTGAAYAVTAEDFGADIRVEITYTDNRGQVETLTSAAAAQGEQVDLRVVSASLIDNTLDRGQALRLALDIQNVGNTAVQSTQTELYLSTDDVISRDNDILLSSLTLTAIQPNGFVEQMSQAALPLTLNPGQTYYVGAVLDALNTEDETNELNNRSPVFEFTVNAEPGETISGTRADDAIQGTGGDDTIAGRRGNDTITPGAGDDTIDGGIGPEDILILDGPQSDYTLTLSDDGITLRDRRENGEGTDTIDRVEFLYFGDEVPINNGQAFNLDQLDGATDVTPEELDEIVELYIAYFNRAPDAIGLAFWATQYAEGLSIEQMADSFFDQVETRATYAGVVDGDTLIDPDAFVTAVYTNVLGRAPDQAGFDFWSNALANSSAVTPANFILEIIKGAKFPANPVPQSLVDQEYLSDKTDIGTYFAVIRGMSNVDNAAQVMSFFDGSDASIGQAVAATDGHFGVEASSEGGAFLMPIVGVLDNPFI